MLYYVLDAQGNSYGPVDVATLNSWVRDGRIVPNTQVMIQATGKVVPATMVPGLNLEMAPGIGLNPAGPSVPRGFPMQPPSGQAPSWQQPPSAGAFSNYGDRVSGSGSYSISMALSGISFLTCFLAPPLCPLLGIAAYFYARRARDEGHPNAGTAATLSIALVLVSLLVLLVARGMIGAVQGGM